MMIIIMLIRKTLKVTLCKNKRMMGYEKGHRKKVKKFFLK